MTNSIQIRSGIPAEMKRQRRWIEKTGIGKRDMPKGWNNPEIWKTLDDIPEDKYFGFAACGHGSTYAVADFDHCIDDNGNLFDGAAEVIKQIQAIAPTYWETSVSGHGLHCIVDLGVYAGAFHTITNDYQNVILWMDPETYKALPEEEQKKIPKIELFYNTNGRYLLLTGKRSPVTGWSVDLAENEEAASIWTDFLSILEENHSKYGSPKRYDAAGKNYTHEVDPETEERILSALPYISANDYETWIRVGIALYNSGISFDVWDEWSRYSDQLTGEICDKYNPEETPKKWESFDGSAKYTAGTIFYLAKQNGWKSAPEVDLTNVSIDDADSTVLDILIAVQPEKAYKWDDKGNGALFADMYQKKVRWNVTSKEWYQYNGRIWTEDTGGMIASRCAKELADALLVYCTTLQDETVKSNYLKHIAKLGQLKYRRTMLEDAKDKYFMSAPMLDADKNLLNVENGVLNLTTFEFLPHSPDLMMSRICNARYDPAAAGTRWRKFIDDIMLGDTEKIDFLQRILGYALTGETKEETCYILYGKTTRNGKSTLTETISYMLGSSEGYAMNMRPETLAQKKDNDSRRASSDIARLKDCRFLNASEPPKRMVFDVALLKTFLGRDSITARFLNQNEFQFIPYFKLFINTNFLPLITDETLFTSGRITVITFDKHFEPQEQDRSLKDKLREPESLSGILNWCLEGLRKYRELGAVPPASVTAATEEYRESSDKLGQFLAERMIKCENRNSSAGDVYTWYSIWCNDNGYGCENKGNFFADLQNRGIFAKAGTVNGKTVRNIVRGYIRGERE